MVLITTLKNNSIMNKKMRHADRVLSNARNYCQTISQKREENTLRKVVTKLTEQKPSQVQFNSNVKMYKAFNIVKMAKGDFRVQADGQVIERRFKSKTQAEDWCSKHHS